ncbi:hypothetical protein LguiA_017185 [Lonicera macranthoides]
MLSKLCFKPSTNRTLSIQVECLPTLPIPMILPLALSPKVTFPPFLGIRLKKLFFSPVMCFEQPLSKNHLVLLPLAFKHTYTITLSNFSFGTQNVLGPFRLANIMVPFGTQASFLLGKLSFR